MPGTNTLLGMVESMTDQERSSLLNGPKVDIAAGSFGNVIIPDVPKAMLVAFTHGLHKSYHHKAGRPEVDGVIFLPETVAGDASGFEILLVWMEVACASTTPGELRVPRHLSAAVELTRAFQTFGLRYDAHRCFQVVESIMMETEMNVKQIRELWNFLAQPGKTVPIKHLGDWEAWHKGKKDNPPYVELERVDRYRRK